MSRQVQKELSEIFIRNGKTYFSNAMVTITQVKLTPDLGMARVYLSVFPNKNVEELFIVLDNKHGEIKRQLGNQLGKRTRKIPELSFFHDEVDDQASKMDKLIDSLNIPPAPEDQ